MSGTIVHHPDIDVIVHLLIPHATRPAVLLVDEGGEWTLPYYIAAEHHFGVVGHINRFAADHFDLRTATLRCVRVVNDPDSKTVARFYAMENLNPDWVPPAGMRWATRDDLDTVLDDLLVRDILVEWFSWLAIPAIERPAWTEYGWFKRMEARMLDLAERMDMPGLALAEQRRAWARSCTLRLNTTEGHLFLKAVPQSFSYEPVVTRVLYLRYPQNIPDVRAVDVPQCWMLMRDFHGKLLTQVSDLAVWETAVRRFAEIQMDLSQSNGSFVSLGVPDRHLDYLASQVERLMVDLPDEIDAATRDYLRDRAVMLRNLAYTLIDSAVPLSLTHGDFWPGNVAIRDGHPVFFDWSDTSVTHPFFDLPFFLMEIDNDLPGIEGAHERLRDAYLSPWTRYEPLPALRNAYRIAEVLSPLHMALTYHRFVLPVIEPGARWEMQNMLPHMVRWLAQALKKYEKFDA